MKQDIVNIGEASGVQVGVAPAERLTNPPSADPNYLLPGARSVIALLMPLDSDIVRSYLAGQDQITYSKHELDVNKSIHALAKNIADLLQAEGYRAIAAPTNYNYRYLIGERGLATNPRLLRIVLNWLASPSGRISRALKRKIVHRLIRPQIRRQDWDLIPTISHRYTAVAAGLGSIGWSGNMMSPSFGARVVLDSVITDAVLPPDPMLTSSPCDGCRTCFAVCQSGYINRKESQETTISGTTFTHNLHGHNARCTFICGGLSGQNRYIEWATWSPGRVHLPDSDDEIKDWFDAFLVDNLWRGNMYSGQIRDLFLMGRGLDLEGYLATCYFCRLACWPTREERLENLRLVRAAGERNGNR